MNLQPLHYMLDLWLACREAIDAGAGELVLRHIDAFTRPTPAGRAVLAAVRGAATGDQAHWHDALAVAVAHDLRTIAIAALEGLAIGAARDGNGEVAGRLLGAAERARVETGIPVAVPLRARAGRGTRTRLRRRRRSRRVRHCRGRTRSRTRSAPTGRAGGRRRAGRASRRRRSRSWRWLPKASRTQRWPRSS